MNIHWYHLLVEFMNIKWYPPGLRWISSFSGITKPLSRGRIFISSPSILISWILLFIAKSAETPINTSAVFPWFSIVRYPPVAGWYDCWDSHGDCVPGGCSRLWWPWSHSSRKARWSCSVFDAWRPANNSICLVTRSAHCLALISPVTLWWQLMIERSHHTFLRERFNDLH